MPLQEPPKALEAVRNFFQNTWNAQRSSMEAGPHTLSEAAANHHPSSGQGPTEMQRSMEAAGPVCRPSVYVSLTFHLSHLNVEFKYTCITITAINLKQTRFTGLLQYSGLVAAYRMRKDLPFFFCKWLPKLMQKHKQICSQANLVVVWRYFKILVLPFRCVVARQGWVCPWPTCLSPLPRWQAISKWPSLAIGRMFR